MNKIITISAIIIATTLTAACEHKNIYADATAATAKASDEYEAQRVDALDAKLAKQQAERKALLKEQAAEREAIEAKKEADKLAALGTIVRSPEILSLFNEDKLQWMDKKMAKCMGEQPDGRTLKMSDSICQMYVGVLMSTAEMFMKESGIKTMAEFDKNMAED